MLCVLVVLGARIRGLLVVARSRRMIFVAVAILLTAAAPCAFHHRQQPGVRQLVAPVRSLPSQCAAKEVTQPGEQRWLEGPFLLATLCWLGVGRHPVTQQTARELQANAGNGCGCRFCSGRSRTLENFTVHQQYMHCGTLHGALSSAATWCAHHAIIRTLTKFQSCYHTHTHTLLPPPAPTASRPPFVSLSCASAPVLLAPFTAKASCQCFRGMLLHVAYRSPCPWQRGNLHAACC